MPEPISKFRRNKMIELFKKGNSIYEISKKLKIGYSTPYRVLLKEGLIKKTKNPVTALLPQPVEVSKSKKIILIVDGEIVYEA